MIYDTWYTEVDGYLVHHCEYCGAEIAGTDPKELSFRLNQHKMFVDCTKGAV
jgi:hypothetical protein